MTKAVIACISILFRFTYFLNSDLFLIRL